MWKSTIPSPVGELYSYANDEALCALVWNDDNHVEQSHNVKSIDPELHPVLSKLKEQLTEYFVGSRRTFDIPLAPTGSEFQLAVWKALCKIPFGETRSYSEQAQLIGKPAAVRAVGAANGKNPISIVVPCHRVIGKNGSLTGFGGGVSVKKFLLDHERQFKLGVAKQLTTEPAVAVNVGY